MTIEQEISDIIDVLPDKITANGVTLELNHVNRFVLAETMYLAGLRVVKPEPTIVDLGGDVTPEGWSNWMRAQLQEQEAEANDCDCIGRFFGGHSDGCKRKEARGFA